MAATLDGFELSRLDLEQRREGDVLGAAQSGRRSSLRLLQLLADEDLIGAGPRGGHRRGRRRPRRWPAIPRCGAAVDDLLGHEAEYLEKT